MIHVGLRAGVRAVVRLVVVVVVAGCCHHLAHDAVVISGTRGLTQCYFSETRRVTQKI